jgi:geranyl-CoA carboxylase beta subunit
MSEVARVGAARKGQEAPEEMLEQQAAAIRAHFDAQEDAFYTSGRVLDHGIIDPRDTRKVLAFCLETVLEGRLRATRANAFGIARM